MGSPTSSQSSLSSSSSSTCHRSHRPSRPTCIEGNNAFYIMDNGLERSSSLRRTSSSSCFSWNKKGLELQFIDIGVAGKEKVRELQSILSLSNVNRADPSLISAKDLIPLMAYRLGGLPRIGILTGVD